MSETVTKPHYYMIKTVLPGTIGFNANLDPRTDSDMWICVGDYYQTFLIPTSDLIDVTQLIEFCEDHGIKIQMQSSWRAGRYKNIYEVLTDLEEKDLLTEARKRYWRLFELMIEDESAIEAYWNKKHMTVPYITDVTEIVPEKVVRVTFADGTSEKAVCCEPDKFSLETGISICIAKKILGGSAAYNKAVKQGVKAYERKLAVEKFKAEEEERAKKKREKRNAYKARRAARRKAEQILKDEAEKERQIEIQKQAYIEAMEYMSEKLNEKSKENK